MADVSNKRSAEEDTDKIMAYTPTSSKKRKVIVDEDDDESGGITMENGE